MHIEFIRQQYLKEYPKSAPGKDSYFDREVKPKLLSLNPEQRKKARKIIEGFLSSGNKNYILTGEAGTGKSYTMKVIMYIMTDLRYIPVVTATTNLAASLHDRAVTINNFMKLSLNIQEGCTVENFNKELKRSAEAQGARWLYPHGAHGFLLYIDEVSMLSAETAMFLNKLIEWKESEHMSNNSTMPFIERNKLQILGIGDFKQLEPINGSLLYKDPVIKGGTNLSDKNFYRRRNFELVRLKTNMRQADDQEYAQILDLISNGVKLSDSQELREFFRREFTKSTKETPSATALNIIFNNDDIDEFNEAKLKELFSDKQIVTLQGELSIARTFIFQNNSKKKLVEQRIKETKIEEEIRIAVGCPVILKKKVKTPDGETIANGTRGIVTEIDPKQEFIKIDVDGEIFTIPKIMIEETYINEEGKEIKLYSLIQIPVRLAYALSYSSVQGMTVTGDVVIYGFCKVKAANGEAQKVPTKIFNNNVLYVALSRVKASQNLYFFTGAPDEHKLYYDLLIGSYRTNYETIKWLQSA